MSLQFKHRERLTQSSSSSSSSEMTHRLNKLLSALHFSILILREILRPTTLHHNPEVEEVQIHFSRLTSENIPLVCLFSAESFWKIKVGK